MLAMRGSAITFALTWSRCSRDSKRIHAKTTVGFRFDDPREWHLIFYIYVVADAFAILERAMFPPDLARLLGDLAVEIDLIFSDR
jgi:hypothetical protein